MLRHKYTAAHWEGRLQVSLRERSACQGHQQAIQCARVMSQDMKALCHHKQMTGDLAVVIGVWGIISSRMRISQR